MYFIEVGSNRQNAVGETKKIIAVSATSLKVKIADPQKVILIDFAGLEIKKDVVYVPSRPVIVENIYTYINNGNYSYILGVDGVETATVVKLRHHISFGSGQFSGTMFVSPDSYSKVVWKDFGENDQDEPHTETLTLASKETHTEFMERIQSRLLHLTRRASVLRHELPHLSSRSRRVCLDLDDRDEQVHRYDHAINLLRLPVGWLQNMINAYQAQWNAHLERVEDAKKKNQPEPEFTRYNDRNPIETLLEKIETTLTKDALIEHHETHDTTEWQNAHAARKIVLCDENCGVGEEIADINSYHTSNGVTNHRLAEKSFHDVAVTYWNQALQTPYRKLVRERIIEV